MTLVDVTTRSRWFTCIRLLWYSPDGIAVPPFPVTFTTMALYHSSLRWFEASTCMAASRGPPSSSIKHGLKFPSSPSWHTATCNSQLGTGSQTKRRVKKTLLLYNIWAIPTLACSCPHTTIGPRRLNCRVRYGAGCFPPRYLHPEYLFTQEYIGK